MKPIRSLAVLLPLLLGMAQANLVITEVNSNGSPADFWELTNFGNTSVDLGGYKWTDTSNVVSVIPAGTSILPSESILFVTSGTVANFRSAWNLAGSVQVILGGPSFSADEAVFLSDANSSAVTSLSYAAGGFTRSTGSTALGGHAGVSAGGAANQSLVLDPNYPLTSRRYTFASGANLETYAAVSPNTGVGSPGKVGAAGVNSAPIFTSPTQAYWKSGTALTSSPFRVVAKDMDPNQTLTLSVISKPSWLSFTLDGAGIYRLNGTPPAAGDFTFTIRATDNAPQPGVTETTVTLTALATSSPILLNEYNAVAANVYLRGGTATQDGLGVSPGPTDSHFGRIPGNGGEWVEFVVVGNGSGGSTTDMRGWTIEILGKTDTRSIKLSQAPYWETVISGTLLTFTAANTANGGLDTSIHRTSALNSLGYVWTNIWVMDPAMISQAASNISLPLGIDSNDTRFVVRNALGAIIYGPAGEGVATADPTLASALLGVSSSEILRLEQEPAPGVDPLFGAYDDADTSSTFGSKNAWGSGPTVQTFSVYQRTNSPPRITSAPVTRAYGNFSYPVTTSDPNGNVVTLSGSGLPSFLTLTPGGPGSATLANNRPLTLADAGQHTIHIIANDGGSVAATSSQSFILTVFHHAPSVIFNEFNAVSAASFLNGGDGAADSDGAPPSVDSHFGRPAGNGGQWFELVVVGNGGPSTVDLRGWSIEIGSSIAGNFTPVNRLQLSQAAYWASVPAGTLLTFIGSNSAGGGLDSEINRRNRLSTLGDAWTNVWIGDPALLVYTGAQQNGYTLGGNTVAGLRIDNNDTQFIVKNPGGQAVFGPVGEGIAPLSGVSSTEVFELEGHPSLAISPLVVATLDELGYDDGASGSTFGEANRWQSGGGGEEIVQNFSPFILANTAYATWASSFNLTGLAAQGHQDPDADGRNNLTEYAFGGNPALADAAPGPQTISRAGGTVTWSYLRRADDPALVFEHQYSDALAAWFPVSAGQVQVSSLAHPTLAGYQITTVVITATPADRRFFRSFIGNF